MTSLEIWRLYGLPQRLEAANVRIVTRKEERKFDIDTANGLVEYFNAEPAARAVTYNACHYDSCGWVTARYAGKLTIKRNGDFTFLPA